MNKTKIVSALVAIVLVIALVACTAEPQNPLVGKWSFPLGVIEIKADGTITINSLVGNTEGTWEEKDGKLITKYPGQEPSVVEYTLNGDTLVINGITYTRVK